MSTIVERYRLLVAERARWEIEPDCARSNYEYISEQLDKLWASMSAEEREAATVSIRKEG
jgi:hypothetical protein